MQDSRNLLERNMHFRVFTLDPLVPHVLDHVELHLVLRREDHSLQLLQRLLARLCRRRRRRHLRRNVSLIAARKRQMSNVRNFKDDYSKCQRHLLLFSRKQGYPTDFSTGK